jgi:hypothetical protein
MPAGACRSYISFHPFLHPCSALVPLLLRRVRRNRWSLLFSCLPAWFHSQDLSGNILNANLNYLYAIFVFTVRQGFSGRFIVLLPRFYELFTVRQPPHRTFGDLLPRFIEQFTVRQPLHRTFGGLHPRFIRQFTVRHHQLPVRQDRFHCTPGLLPKIYLVAPKIL